MKVLMADKLPDEYVDRIRELGTDVTFEPKYGASDIVANIADHDVVVVRSTEVTAEAISAAQKLSLIIRAGAGTNNIDKKAASAEGIYVANCPGMNSIAVAELAMGLICALDRRIADNVCDLRKGKWNKAAYSKAEGLYGKTLGVVGVGKTGKALIKRAEAFGLRIKAWSRSLTPEKAEKLGVEYAESVQTLVPDCDIISVHLASAPETKGIISREVIDSMKPGAFFINTARPQVVDEPALAEAARDGRIRVGTDVFSAEPEGKTGSFDSEFAKIEAVYGTHHIGASTTQAQNAVAEETVRILDIFLKTGCVENWVNKMARTPAKWQVVVRHYDEPGVLANVLGILKTNKINVEEMENLIFDGAKAACCTIQLDTKPGDEIIDQIAGLEGQVINVELVEIG